MQPDTTIGLVEVMKTFNAVSAGAAGTIVEICVGDTQMVEYGQVLVRVAPEARGVPIERVLIANRGEIALRVIPACQQLGLQTVLAASEGSRPRQPAGAGLADRTVCIGPARSADSLPQSPRRRGRGAGRRRRRGSSRRAASCRKSPEMADACAGGRTHLCRPDRRAHAREMGNKIQARLLARRRGRADPGGVVDEDRLGRATRPPSPDRSAVRSSSGPRPRRAGAAGA